MPFHVFLFLVLLHSRAAGGTSGPWLSRISQKQFTPFLSLFPIFFPRKKLVERANGQPKKALLPSLKKATRWLLSDHRNFSLSVESLFAWWKEEEEGILQRPKNYKGIRGDERNCIFQRFSLLSLSLPYPDVNLPPSEGEKENPSFVQTGSGIRNAAGDTTVQQELRGGEKNFG